MRACALLVAALLAGSALTLGAPATFAGCLADRVSPDETLVRCKDGRAGSLRGDGFGAVSGHIGRDRVELRSDGSGGVQGVVGGRGVAAYDGGFGDLEIFDGRRRLLCRDDGFDGLDCR